MLEHLNILCIIIFKQFSLRMRVIRLLTISLTILAISSLARVRDEDSDVSGKVSSSRLARSPGQFLPSNKREWNSKKRSKTKRNRNGKKRRKTGKNGGNGKRKNRRVKQKTWRGKKTKKAGPRKGGRTVSGSCFTQSVTIMKIWKDLVHNFIRQKKRMERQNRTMLNKSNKKGVFTVVAMTLLKVGGGNLSSLACAGTEVSPGRVLQSRSLELETCLILV